MRISSNYRWVIWLGGPAIFCVKKPKRIIGGFVDQNGEIFKHNQARRFKRAAFKVFYTEWREQKARTIGVKTSEG